MIEDGVDYAAPQRICSPVKRYTVCKPPSSVQPRISTQPELVRLMRKKNSLAPLSLALLAALTPDTY